MKRLVMVGITHRRATLTQLGRAAVDKAGHGPLLAALGVAGCEEAVVLSTCSRVEVYGVTMRGPEPLLVVLAQHCGATSRELRDVVDVREGPAVASHLFRVTSGLESRTLGEPEVAGQVRAAYRAAHAEEMTGAVLEELFSAALRCGARVQSRSTLGEQGRSLAARAVEVGLAALDVAEPVVTVVGSGRMATRAVERLRRAGLAPLVAARDAEAAVRLAGRERARSLSALSALTGQADLLICATSAAHHVVTPEHLHAARSRARRLVVVDLSVPRNVDVAVATAPGVLLIDLESMNDDVAADPMLAAAVAAGTEIVEEALERWIEDVAARRIGALIAALRARVEAACLLQLQASAPATTDPAALEGAAHLLAGRLLHLPTVALRRAAASGDDRALTALGELIGVCWPPPVARASGPVGRTGALLLPRSG